MVLVQNKCENTLVCVPRIQITFVTHSSPSCYVTLRAQVIRLNLVNLGSQKTDSGVFLIVYVTLLTIYMFFIIPFHQYCFIAWKAHLRRD